MTMYAKLIGSPPKFDYPYQEQQQQSGSFVTSDREPLPQALSPEDIRELEEQLRRLAPAR